MNRRLAPFLAVCASLLASLASRIENEAKPKCKPVKVELHGLAGDAARKVARRVSEAVGYPIHAGDLAELFFGALLNPMDPVSFALVDVFHAAHQPPSIHGDLGFFEVPAVVPAVGRVSTPDAPPDAPPDDAELALIASAYSAPELVHDIVHRALVDLRARVSRPAEAPGA